MADRSSPYRSVPFIVWQTSIRSSAAHRYAREARSSAIDALTLVRTWETEMYWFLEGHPKPSRALRLIMEAAIEAQDADRDASAAFAKAVRLERSADPFDERAQKQAGNLHSQAVVAENHTKKAARQARTALRTLTAFKPRPDRVTVLPSST